MIAQELKKEEAEVRKAIAKKGAEKSEVVSAEAPVVERKKRRWDDSSADAETPAFSRSDWEASEATPGRLVSSEALKSAPTPSRWDITPAAVQTGKLKSRWDETPADASVSKKSGWDVPTPSEPTHPLSSATPTPSTKKKSRWDETPMAGSSISSLSSSTPGATPLGNVVLGAATPALGPMTPEMTQRIRWEAEVEERNRPLSDDELDAMFPTTGYRILEPPASYVPIRTPQRKLLATPTPLGATPGFAITETPSRESYAIPPTPSESAVPFIKPEDYQYFGKLLDESAEEDLPVEEMKERKIMKLLLKIKNGTPPQRKTAMRQISDKGTFKLDINMIFSSFCYYVHEYLLTSNF